MIAHVRDQAAGIAALRETDPERIAAYEHAATCDDCARALAEGKELCFLIDAALPVEPPTPAVLERVRRAVVAEEDAQQAAAEAARRPSGPPSAWIAILVAALAAWFDTEGGGLVARVGIECILIELGAAIVPIGFLASRAISGRAPPPVRTVAAFAAWAALSADAYLHFRCPAAHDAPHVAVFHFGGVVIAALLGLVAGRRLRAHAR